MNFDPATAITLKFINILYSRYLEYEKLNRKCDVENTYGVCVLPYSTLDVFISFEVMI